MGYKEKYEMALERAREWYNKTEPDSYTCIVESIFHELKESEDERLRKELVNYFTEGREFLSLCSFGRDKILAWLEKQGEKPADKKEPKKVESQQAEIQKWSEEDEKMFIGLTTIVEDWYNSQSKKEKEYYGDCGYSNWLQSIKQRKSWKPSDKQLTELRCAISGCSFETSTLIKLEEDLKRLL